MSLNAPHVALHPNADTHSLKKTFFPQNPSKWHNTTLIWFMTFNSYNFELLLSVLSKMLVLVLVVAECSSSPAPPPLLLIHPSSQQLQQQWANRCLRECPLRCPSCQNHPRPWRPQRQLFPGRLHSPHHHPVLFPPHLLPFTREMCNMQRA